MNAIEADIQTNNSVSKSASSDYITPDQAHRAVLFATFYVKRDSNVSEELFKSLATSFSLKDVSEEFPEALPGVPARHWGKKDAPAIILDSFSLSEIPDTTFIQLVLNPSDNHSPATESWEELRNKLSFHLPKRLLESEYTWGYTLFYYAVLKEGVATPKKLGINQVLSLFADECPHPFCSELATDVESGRMWLVDSPNLENKFAPGKIHVVLNCHGSKKEEKALLFAIYGPRSPMLIPDSIASKGYHQIRQYYQVDPVGKNFTVVRDALSKVLDSIESAGSDAFQKEFDQLAKDYDKLLGKVPHLEALYVSLKKIVYNYEQCLKRVSENKILQHHYSHLDTKLTELSMQVEEGKGLMVSAGQAVQIADTALEQHRALLEKERENQEREFHFHVEELIIILTVFQVVGQMVTGSFFTQPWFSILFLVLQLLIIYLILRILKVDVKRVLLKLRESDQNEPSSKNKPGSSRK